MARHRCDGIRSRQTAGSHSMIVCSICHQTFRQRQDMSKHSVYILKLVAAVD